MSATDWSKVPVEGPFESDEDRRSTVASAFAAVEAALIVATCEADGGEAA